MECSSWIIATVILGFTTLMEFIIIIMLLVALIKGKKPAITGGSSE